MMTGHNFLPNKLITNVDTQSPTILPEMPYSSNQVAKQSLNRPYNSKKFELSKERTQSLQKLNEMNDQVIKTKSHKNNNNRISHRVS